MEHRDRERIISAAQRNAHLKRLYREHIELEEQLSRISKRPFLTADEQQEEVALKKKKLRGVDLMMSLLAEEPCAAEAH